MKKDIVEEMWNYRRDNKALSPRRRHDTYVIQIHPADFHKLAEHKDFRFSFGEELGKKKNEMPTRYFNDFRIVEKTDVPQGVIYLSVDQQQELIRKGEGFMGMERIEL